VEKEKRLLSEDFRNKVWQLLRRGGLDPGEFAWEDRDSQVASNEIVTALVHRPTGHYFLFDYRAHHYHAVYTPGRKEHREEVRTETWGRQLTSARQWMNNLVQALRAVPR